MDALWNLEDKLKLSTPKAVAFLACIALLITGICIATVLRRRRAERNKPSSVHQEPPCMEEEPEEVRQWLQRPRAQQQPSWGGMKKVLMSSVRWSGVIKWEEGHHGEKKPTPLLVSSARFQANVGWESHNSTSPVWQRPILMGEKCEMPRFSGLILYDQRGKPLDHLDHGTIHYQGVEEESATAIGTTLRDLL